jgi:hypothetical protein
MRNFIFLNIFMNFAVLTLIVLVNSQKVPDPNNEIILPHGSNELAPPYSDVWYESILVAVCKY